jgi:hypothetical protein
VTVARHAYNAPVLATHRLRLDALCAAA